MSAMVLKLVEVSPCFALGATQDLPDRRLGGQVSRVGSGQEAVTATEENWSLE